MRGQSDLQKIRRGLATRKDILETFHATEFAIEESRDELREEMQSFKEDIQGQLHDIFNELKSLRQQILYFQSRKDRAKK